MSYIFDGPTKRITLPAQDTIYVSDLYSRWKDWTLVGDNTKFLPAFSVVGGDAITATASLATNVFIRNDIGWRIMPPPGVDIDIVLVGNIYPTDPLTSWRTSPGTDNHTSINTDNSANALTVEVGGTGTSWPSSGIIWP